MATETKHENCEVCGYKFPSPRTTPRCKSEKACAARVAAKGGPEKPGGGKPAPVKAAAPAKDPHAAVIKKAPGKVAARKANARKAVRPDPKPKSKLTGAERTARLNAIREETASVKAWEDAGSDPATRPDTPNLDNLHAEGLARQAAHDETVVADLGKATTALVPVEDMVQDENGVWQVASA
jgi:hypothetical protein